MKGRKSVWGRGGGGGMWIDRKGSKGLESHGVSNSQQPVVKHATHTDTVSVSKQACFLSPFVSAYQIFVHKTCRLSSTQTH